MNACPVCKGSPRSGLHHAPTLADLMADPLIHMMMAADRVDPAALEAFLRTLARTRWPAPSRSASCPSPVARRHAAAGCRRHRDGPPAASQASTADATAASDGAG